MYTIELLKESPLFFIYYLQYDFPLEIFTHTIVKKKKIKINKKIKKNEQTTFK